jgi:hypothetical protein
LSACISVCQSYDLYICLSVCRHIIADNTRSS